MAQSQQAPFPPLPNLSQLPRGDAGAIVEKDPHGRVVDGIYCLDALRDQKSRDEPDQGRLEMSMFTCDSALVLLRHAVPVDAIGAGYESMRARCFAYMRDDALVPPTRNPYNAGSVLLRKQITFRARDAVDYSFSGQQVLNTPLDEAPDLVQRVLDYTKRLIVANRETYAQWADVDPDTYNAVHCNLYATPAAAVKAHQDNEAQLIVGAPIFSYTFLASKDGSGAVRPREFEIATPYMRPVGGKNPRLERDYKRVAGVTLGDGDLLVMQGDMQSEWYHRIVAGSNKLHANTMRVNMTVRAFHKTDNL